MGIKIGNSRTAVICTINPQMSNIPETINTLKFGMNAGVIKNQIKLNERELYKSSVEKFSVEKTLFDQTLKENNELKLEMGKCDENVNNLLEKIRIFERNQLENLEKINVLNNESEFLSNENKNLMVNNEIFAKENESLRRNNQELMKIAKEFKEIERKSQSFANLQKKLQEMEETVFFRGKHVF